MNILVTMCNNIIIRKSNESIMVSCLGDSLNEISNAPVNVTPQGGGGQTSGILTEQNIAVRSPHPGQKLHVRILGFKKKYFLPFIFKSSDFPLGE